MTATDMADALAFSMGIKIVVSPFVEPGKVYLFREPLPLNFKLQVPEYQPDLDRWRMTAYLDQTIRVRPADVGMIIMSDIGQPERRRKWHRKGRGPRRRNRR